MVRATNQEETFNRAHGFSPRHTDVQKGTSMFSNAYGFSTGHMKFQQGTRKFNRAN